MRVGIGFSNDTIAFKSGKKIAQKALRDGNIRLPKIALAFCSLSVDAEDLLQGIKSVLGSDIPVLGGSSIGIITNDTISYNDSPAGIVIDEDDDLKFDYAIAEGLNNGERFAGDLISNIIDAQDGDRVLLFYDSIKQPPTATTPPILNSSIPLLKALENGCNKVITIFGAGLIGDKDFSPTVQFAGDCVKSQCAIVARMRGRFSTDFKIMHGCSLKDGIYHTITKLEGPIIYEIDHRPAQEVITEIYGSEEWKTQTPLRRLTIGVNYSGSKWQEFDEQNYVNRLILGPSPDDSGIIIFEEDLEEGVEFQFMLRDPLKMNDSAKHNTQTLIEEIKAKGKTPIWGLYIDCAGRCAQFSDIIKEEATEVQKILNENNIQLFGIYSGVEIAPFLGKHQGLDWTGVLTIFSI